MDWKFEKNMYPILDTRVECKVATTLSRSLKLFNWNITRLECKVSLSFLMKVLVAYWNITRLECKVFV